MLTSDALPVLLGTPRELVPVERNARGPGAAPPVHDERRDHDGHDAEQDQEKDRTGGRHAVSVGAANDVVNDSVEPVGASR